MKRTLKHNSGFTLIELVVAMAVAVIVTAAATSVLLFGLNVNRQSADTASRQMTVRALLNVVEKAAADGNIQGITTDYESWQLLDQKTVIEDGKQKTSGRIIFGFDSEEQMIYSNGTMVDGVVTSTGTEILKGVYASNAIIEGKLLSVSVETKEGIFTSSVYCRITDLKDNSDSNELPGTSGEDPRGKFIGILKSQYRSRGAIREAIQIGTDSNGDPIYEYYDTDTYYSEWYCGGSYWKGWNEKTPWCACYISWALSHEEVKNYLPNPPKERWYANVDDFMKYFTTTPKIQSSTWIPSEVASDYTQEIDYDGLIGNLIFFDWDKGNNPEHVGVVLEVVPRGNTHIIYTIEGNSSGRVAIRSYSINDPRIIGYGVLF